MRSWFAILVLPLCLVGCASLLFYTDPLNSLVAELRDPSGDKVEAFDVDSDPQRTFIGLLRFTQPGGEEQSAEFDRAGNLQKLSSPDGSFIDFDWSNPSLITMTAGGVIDGALVTETKSFPREPEKEDGSLALSSRRRSLATQIQPTSVTLRVSACPSRPTLRDIHRVALNMDYGAGRSLWFMDKLQNGVYRSNFNLQIVKEKVFKRRLETANLVKNAINVLCKNPVAILCNGLDNAALTGKCGKVGGIPQKFACKIFKSISDEDVHWKEVNYKSITGDFVAQPDIVYTNAARQQKSLIVPAKKYTNGQPPLQFEAQLPCQREFVGTIRISGRLSSNICTQGGRGSGQAEIRFTLSEDGSSAFVNSVMSRTFTFPNCWSGGPYPNSLSKPATKSGTNSFAVMDGNDADQFQFKFNIEQSGSVTTTVQVDHDYCDPGTGGCVRGTFTGSGSLSPQTPPTALRASQ